MTDKEREQAAYCVARHYVVFYRQTLNEDRANCWDACMYCKLKSERCAKGSWEWMKTVDEWLRESGFAVCPIVGGYEAFGSYEQPAKATSPLQ